MRAAQPLEVVTLFLGGFETCCLVHGSARSRLMVAGGGTELDRTNTTMQLLSSGIHHDFIAGDLGRRTAESIRRLLKMVHYQPRDWGSPLGIYLPDAFDHSGAFKLRRSGVQSITRSLAHQCEMVRQVEDALPLLLQ